MADVHGRMFLSTLNRNHTMLTRIIHHILTTFRPLQFLFFLIFAVIVVFLELILISLHGFVHEIGAILAWAFLFVPVVLGLLFVFTYRIPHLIRLNIDQHISTLLTRRFLLVIIKVARCFFTQE